MIAHIHGTLCESSPARVVVESAGVGYLLTIPVSSYRHLPPVGQTVRLLTYHHVHPQEGTHQLFGFATPAERDLFMLLISVTGIGPKLACNILSVASVDELRRAIASADVRYLSSLRGIGKKTAERLILELKDKISPTGTSTTATAEEPHWSDAVRALESLGFKTTDAREAVQRAMRRLGSHATLEDIIRAALRDS
ncbi:MAG: Holliday junction branch migration protein RuvA [Verrucomicrobiae bacterium]|nr:Holliday junction branch migration protein RuvA [Verrucomicrobiae bacterium]